MEIPRRGPAQAPDRAAAKKEVPLTKELLYESNPPDSEDKTDDGQTDEDINGDENHNPSAGDVPEALQNDKNNLGENKNCIHFLLSFLLKFF